MYEKKKCMRKKIVGLGNFFETSEETNTVEKKGKKVSESKSGAVRCKDF